MSARLIQGKPIAEEVEREVAQEVERLSTKGIEPGLTVIRVGSDPASEVYVRSKERKAKELGIRGVERHLPEETTQEELMAEIDRLNSDDSVDGILLQLPVPGHLDSDPLIRHIAPEKDVDGFHPINVGKLQLGQPCLIPCTPAGAIRLIESTGEAIKGKAAVVVGRSNIVGKPVAALLLHRHATVTICHSRTSDLAQVIRLADIVIAAVGKPLMIDGSWIKPGAIVIDVGINRIEASSDAASRLSLAKKEKLDERGNVLVGDVDFPSASEVAGWITPVPGGVGPMTIAMLMKNTIQAAQERRG